MKSLVEIKIIMKNKIADMNCNIEERKKERKKERD